MKASFRSWAVAVAVGFTSSIGLAANLTGAPEFPIPSQAVLSSQDVLSRLVTEIQSANGCVTCDMRVLYSIQASVSQLTAAQMAGLNQISKTNAAVWDKTIMVGDYEADGKLQIDQVVGIFESGNLVAFDVTYSEGATELESCDYADVQNGQGARCINGRMRESAYVSADMTSSILDSQGLAHFVSN